MRVATLHCLSLFLHHENAWNVVQGISKFLKFSRRSMPPDPPTSLYLFIFKTHPPPPPPRKILATRLDFHETIQIIHVSRGTKKTNHASHAFSHESRLFFGCFHASRISSWPDHPLRINTLLPSTRTRFNFLYRLLSLFKKFPYIHCIKMIICPTFVSNDPLAQPVERGANNAKPRVRDLYGLHFNLIW